MNRVTLSFTDDDDLGTLQETLRLYIETLDDNEFCGDSIKRAERLKRRVERARERLDA